MDFYMVLPSNVRRNDDVENKTSRYLTPLPKPLELNKNKWEVALAEFSYPHSWYNVTSEYSYITTSIYGGFAFTLDVRMDFSPGYYNGYSLAVALNEMLKLNEMSSKFTYTEGANRMQLKLFPDEGIALPEQLARMMGWETEREFHYEKRGRSASATSTIPSDGGNPPTVSYEYYPQTVNPERCVELNPTTHHLYVYCNLIAEIMVGDIFAKLLRTISTRSEDYGQYVTRIFTSPHYQPLESSFENFVEISVRDDGGKLIPFESGKVIATLHFRRRQ